MASDRTARAEKPKNRKAEKQCEPLTETSEPPRQLQIRAITATTSWASIVPRWRNVGEFNGLLAIYLVSQPEARHQQHQDRIELKPSKQHAKA